MRLTPDEFETTEESAFENDRLNREPQVLGLCEIIQAVDGHAVVSIDGPWGSGKTAFVKMCAAQLDELGIQVVEFNAWQESYTKNPLVDLVSAVAEKTDTAEESAKRTLVSLGWHIAEQATDGWVRRGALKNGGSATFDPWKDAHTKVGELKKKLKEIAAATCEDEVGKLVVLIDELDRCRPAYALELIEAVRHLFAVEGVVVLLAINREELCHSIQSLYGAEFDTDRYLRRFIDLPCALPPPTPRLLSVFTGGLLAALNLDTRFVAHGGNPDYSSVMLKKIAETAGHNLRDLQQAIHLAAVAMQSKSLGSEPRQVDWLTNQKAVALIILRAFDKDAYLRLAYKDGNAFAAVAAMNRAITEDPQTLGDASDRDQVHERIEVCLLAETYDQISIMSPSSRKDADPSDFFSSRYMEEFAKEFGDSPAVQAIGKVRANWILEGAISLLRDTTASGRRIDELVGIIDLIGYEPADA